MMARMYQAIFAVLIFNVCVNAAPSNIKLEDIANVEQAVKLDEEPNVKLDDEPNSLLEETNSNNTSQGQRQKRFYNYYGYGLPPMNPVIYPNYFNRDESFNNGGYGYEDPFTQIHKRLLDIASVIRQPNAPPLPPPISHFPIFFPVIYIPQAGCACFPPQNIPPNQPPSNNDSSVDISNRFPDMEDERQNWGIVVNDTEMDDGQEEDFTRPISFEPIRPNRTMTRPPPAVEHGSNQGGANAGPTTTTTVRPNPPSAAAPPEFPPEPPSACDGAVLGCCHQPQVTYDCFAIQGCPDPSSFGNPCEPQVILRVIDRFQKFYNQRVG